MKYRQEHSNELKLNKYKEELGLNETKSKTPNILNRSQIITSNG